MPLVLGLALLLAAAAPLGAQPQPSNPQAPAGQASPTAPNAQGMMTDPGPARIMPPSGVPGSQNVNPGEPRRAMPPPALPPDSPAPRHPPAPGGSAR